jgi:hypothetical protein
MKTPVFAILCEVVEQEDIPLDHLYGATPCFESILGFQQKIYKGDGNADIGDGWSVQSARVYSTQMFYGPFNNGVQSSPAYQGPFLPAVGQTRNYGWFSPSNGSTLSSQEQRFTTYYWGPPRSDETYVFGCLVLQQGKIVGQSSPNKKVPCD